MHKTLTFQDIVLEHYRLNISYDLTVKIVERLCPDKVTEAQNLWKQLQTQTAYQGANHA